MAQKQLLPRAGRALLDVVEKYIPMLCFCVLFVVFMLEIVFRYFFVPLVWTLELSLLTYLWTVLFGTCLAERDDAHTRFTLLYDLASTRGKRIMRIAGNALLVSSFLIALYPSYRFVAFMSFKKSDVLKIPMNLAFSPFLAFLLILIGRYGWQLVQDVRALARREVKA